MKLTVEGFKSIKKVKEFEFMPFTVLAGINSSGKSSLIQILLLLKQTLSSKDILSVKGPYVYADSIKDLLYWKEGGELKIAISAKVDEMSHQAGERFSSLLGRDAQMKTVSSSFTFYVNGKVKLTQLTLNVDGEQETSYSWKLTEAKDVTDAYELQAKQVSTGMRVQTLPSKKYIPQFENFIPLYFEEYGSRDASTMDVKMFKSVAAEALLYYLHEVMDSIYYIKALRVEPDLKKSYNTAVNRAYIDSDGQNLQFVYNEKKNEPVRGKETLNEALVRWLGKELDLSHDIDIHQDEEKFYHTLLQMQKGLDVDLCQVGFGVSQVLPILVQGLLTPKGGTLIVEDPEVHMHPRVQAGLVDFFIEMIQDGKDVIIETHSDHFVTRIRRRVAEKQLDPQVVNLCFVSRNQESGSLYQTIDVKAQGVLQAPLPEGFLDVQDDDFRAILRAKLENTKIETPMQE